jgi:hypothetical protein
VTCPKNVEVKWLIQLGVSAQIRACGCMITNCDMHGSLVAVDQYDFHRVTASDSRSLEIFICTLMYRFNREGVSSSVSRLLS